MACRLYFSIEWILRIGTLLCISCISLRFWSKLYLCLEPIQHSLLVLIFEHTLIKLVVFYFFQSLSILHGHDSTWIQSEYASRRLLLLLCTFKELWIQHLVIHVPINQWTVLKDLSIIIPDQSTSLIDSAIFLN